MRERGFLEEVRMDLRIKSEVGTKGSLGLTP